MFFNKSPQKNDFRPFLHFWPCQVPLWTIGAEKQPAKRPNGPLPKKLKYFKNIIYNPIELGPSVCQWIQNINIIRQSEGPNRPTVPQGLVLALLPVSQTCCICILVCV